MGKLFSATFSPDNNSIVAVSSGRTARIWNARTGELLLTLEGHASEVLAVAFSPDW